jgi:hypothetical protein
MQVKLAPNHSTCARTQHGSDRVSSRAEGKRERQEAYLHPNEKKESIISVRFTLLVLQQFKTFFYFIDPFVALFFGIESICFGSK